MADSGWQMVTANGDLNHRVAEDTEEMRFVTLIWSGAFGWVQMAGRRGCGLRAWRCGIV